MYNFIMTETGTENSVQGKKLTRRKFLKGLTALAGSVLIGCSGNPGTSSEISQPDSKFLPDIVFGGETYSYDGESASLIEKIKNNYGVSIISPKTWGENNEPNLPYGLEEISYIAETINQLPPEYLYSSRSPKEILLLRGVGSLNEGAGGGYYRRRLIVFTSEKFDPDSQMQIQSEIPYGTQKNHLMALIVHEYTHSFIETYPEIMNDWNQQMKWIKKPDGSWINQNPQNLPHSGNADLYPWEDIAVSTSLMFVNPSSLSADRISFFLKNQHYQSWPAVILYKKNHF